MPATPSSTRKVNILSLLNFQLFSSRPIVGGEEVRFLPLLIVGYQRLVFTRGVALIELMQWAAIYLEMIMRGELIEEAIVPKQSLEKIIDQICSKRLTTVSDICESAMDPWIQNIRWTSVRQKQMKTLTPAPHAAWLLHFHYLD